jgi:hypothetical protein
MIDKDFESLSLEATNLAKQFEKEPLNSTNYVEFLENFIKFTSNINDLETKENED